MILDLIRTLLPAAGATIAVTAASFAIGAVIAVPVMLMRISRSSLLRGIARVYIEIVRGLPPVVWLFILFFGISFGAFKLSAWQAAIGGLGLISSAYLAEYYRSGYLSIHQGQFEAAAALGMSRSQAFASVIAPQTVRVALPSATTYLLGLLKDSSLASTIGVTEVVFVSTAYSRVSGDGIVPFAFAALVYVILSVPIGLLSRVLDSRLREKVSA